MFSHIQEFYRSLPDKKRYAEFISAVLTIPMFALVIVSNYSSLHKKPDQGGAPTPTSTPAVLVLEAKVEKDDVENAVKKVVHTAFIATPTTTPSPASTTPEACKKEVGPVEITNPAENSQVSKDPVCIDITRTGSNYCGVSWTYRINGSDWSLYTDKSICLYGLTAGQKHIDLMVRSIASENEVLLSRNFTVLGSVTPTSAQVATDSANNP